MRGNPLVEAALFVVLWGLLAVPLALLTRGPGSRDPGEQAPGPVVSAADMKTAAGVWAELRFSHVPDAFTVRHGKTILWEDIAPTALREMRALPLRVGAGTQLMLALRVVWPPEVDAGVAELTLEPDGLASRARHVWGQGAYEDTLEFAWPHE
jgi:hypothetical protein